MNKMYQISTLQALALGYTRAVVTADQLLEHGDTGLGTYEDVNGEMITLDGRCFRASDDGSIKGIPELFKITKEMFTDSLDYREFGIQVENYIVSTGFAEIIKGCELMPFVEKVWGCELIEEDGPYGERVINEIGYTIDNTTKTRAIFEINKGIHVLENVNVNSNIPEEFRRVHMNNMIYIADGPSDIPAFSVVKKGGGSTFAIYPHGDVEALRQVEQMRIDGRVDMYAEADYSEGTTAHLWITNKIQDIAERIKREEKEKIMHSVSEAPRHLT